MRVVIVGGDGAMGQAAARDLVKSDQVERVILASNTVSRERLHPKLAAHENVEMALVDLHDADGLSRWLRQADVAINAAGPFHESALPVARAAIAARTHCVDLCDDHDATESLYELDGEARDAGVTVLTGMGSDPGTPNVLARHAARLMDAVEEVRIYWVMFSSQLTGEGVWRHAFHMFRGEVPQWIDGRRVLVPAGSEPEEVRFLEPCGRCTVSYVGHPEPFTMPRHFPGIRTVVNKGGVAPAWADEFVRSVVRFGLDGTEVVDAGQRSFRPLDATLFAIGRLQAAAEMPDTSASKTIVRGRKGDEEIEVVYELEGKMAPGTGIPASIGAQMLASGRILERGVLAPEAAIDPESFLAEFALRGAEIRQEVTRRAWLGPGA